MTGTGVAAVRSAEGRIHLSNFITALLAKVLCYRRPDLARAANGHTGEGYMKIFKAELSHEEVIADRKVFDKALKQLHRLLGTQFRVPSVAGKDLDLLLLYKKVYRAAIALPGSCSIAP